MAYIGGRYFGKLNNKITVVAIPSVARPTPYLNTNLNESNNTTGTQIIAAEVNGLRDMKIARNVPNNMITCVNSGSIDDVGFYSTNGGTSWNAVPYINNYVYGSTISDDGKALFVTRSHTSYYLLYSYNTGSSWTQVTTGLGTGTRPRGPSCNSNGATVLIVSLNTTTCAVSTNSCASFTVRNTPWTCFDSAMPSDGSVFWITKYNDATNCIIAKSTNSGVNWTPITVASSRSSSCIIRCSNDGKYIALCNGTYIYISSNSGTSWTEKTPSESVNSTTLTMSRTGRYIAIASSVTNGRYLVSSDFGNNWTTKNFSGMSVNLIGALGIQESIT